MVVSSLILFCLLVKLLHAQYFTGQLPQYLDPCHAAGYADDAALSNSEARRLKSKLDATSVKLKGRSRSERGAVADELRLWDDGVIPYQFSVSYSSHQKALFESAMRHWEEHTCLVFVKKQPEHTNWIIFTPGDCGCASFVGNKRLGGQGLSIGRNCDKFGVVVHELGHVVGYWHEQSRPDRDSHVRIQLSNVAQGKLYNFKKRHSWEVDSRGETYDFESIMHYSAQQYARSGRLKTIVPRPNPNIYIGQRMKLSRGDIRQTKKMYKCPVCGSTLFDKKGEFSSPMKKNANTLCQWRITASDGERIVLNITSMFIPRSTNCMNGYVEVRDGYYNKSPLLGRYCGFEVPQPMTSTSNRLWIEFRPVASIGAVDASYEGNYQSVHIKTQYEAICGGDVSEDIGVLRSPNYPDFYPLDTKCAWSLTVPEGWKMLMRFDVFDIESSDDCAFDHIEIRDGCEDNALVLARFCGPDKPHDVISSGNKVCVTFQSDDSVNKHGFLMTFNKVL